MSEHDFNIVTDQSRAIMHSSHSVTTPNTWLHNGAADTDLIGLAAAASTQAYRQDDRERDAGFESFFAFEDRVSYFGYIGGG